MAKKTDRKVSHKARPAQQMVDAREGASRKALARSVTAPESSKSIATEENYSLISTWQGLARELLKFLDSYGLSSFEPSGHAWTEHYTDGTLSFCFHLNFPIASESHSNSSAEATPKEDASTSCDKLPF